MDADLFSNGRFSRRVFIGGAATSMIAIGAGTEVLAHRPPHRVTPIRALGPEHATAWVRDLYDVVQAEGMTPPAAARFYYYASISMYESVRSEMPGYRSLADQVPDLHRVPRPNGRVDGPIALSTALSIVALGLLPALTEASVQRLGGRRQSVVATRSADLRPSDVQRSVEHGERVAAHLLEWIGSDGYAEASTTPYTPPVGPDRWRSTPPNFGTAIEPHWNLVRPALLTSADEIVPEPHVPFSTEVGSEFHEQAMATYSQSFDNTDEQIAIARFWTDNPLLSGLPSGHWFLLLAQLAESPLALSLDRTLEGFVRLGAALHDAFLNCWTWKYRLNLVRPVSYINEHVDSTWKTLVNTPQFPEYTSGHSVSSGAAEVVLTSLFGTFPFVDSTGLARGLPGRSFASFTDAAEEAARSRLYGGIHYPMGIENGVAQGREIGHLINKRLRTQPRRH